MGVMTSKGYDLKVLHAAIPELGALASIQFLGTLTGDGYLANLVQDGKYKIITDPTDVAVGDLVYAGNQVGVVTALPDSDRIKIRFYTAHIQEFGVDPVARVLTYDHAENTADVTDEKKYPRTYELLSGGFVFVRDMRLAVSGSESLLLTDRIVAAGDGVDEVVATVWVRNNDGSVRTAGGDTVVFTVTGAVTGEDSVTDNTDGSYDVTLVNATVETVTITATVEGLDVSDVVSEIQVVFDDIDITDTTVNPADGTGTANGTDTELITVTVYDAAGVAKTTGGDTVVLSSTLSGVLSAVTDVGDGTYTATVTDTVAETTVISATINGIPITDTASIVWS